MKEPSPKTVKFMRNLERVASITGGISALCIAILKIFQLIYYPSREEIRIPPENLRQ